MGQARGGGNPKAARHLRPPKKGERGAGGSNAGRQKGTPNQITKADVQSLIRDIAFFKPGDLIKGKIGEPTTMTLAEFHRLPARIQHAIAGYDVVTQNLNAADGKQDTVIKLRWFDKAPYVTNLAKHFQIINDKELSITVDATVHDRLIRGRQRNAEQHD